MPSLEEIHRSLSNSLQNKGNKTLDDIFKDAGHHDALSQNLRLPIVKALPQQGASSGFKLDDVGTIGRRDVAPNTKRIPLGVVPQNKPIPSSASSGTGSMSSSSSGSITKVAASSQLRSNNAASSTQKSEKHIEETGSVSFSGVLNQRYYVKGTVSGSDAGAKAISVMVAPRDELKSDVDDLYGPGYFRSKKRFHADFVALYLAAGTEFVKHGKYKICVENRPTKLYVFHVDARTDRLWDAHLLCARIPLQGNNTPSVFRSLKKFEIGWASLKIIDAYVEVRRLHHMPEAQDGEPPILEHDEIDILFKGSVAISGGKWNVEADVPRTGQLLQLRGTPDASATRFALGDLDTLMATQAPGRWRSMIPAEIKSGWVAKNYDETNFSYCRSISLGKWRTTSVGLSLHVASLELKMMRDLILPFKDCVLEWLITSPDDDSKTVVQVQCDASVTITELRFDAFIEWKPDPYCHAIHEVTGTESRDKAMVAIQGWFVTNGAACEMMIQRSNEAYEAWQQAQISQQQAENIRFCIVLELRGAKASLYWAVNEYAPEGES